MTFRARAEMYEVPLTAWMEVKGGTFVLYVQLSRSTSYLQSNGVISFAGHRGQRWRLGRCDTSRDGMEMITVTKLGQSRP